MTEREMEDFEREALEAANRIIRKLIRQNNRNDAIYWESPDQRRFYYTPWKDSNGDYWTWVMKPFGRGARSGKATKWKRVGRMVRSRTRKTARQRAYRRYYRWIHRYDHLKEG